MMKRSILAFAIAAPLAGCISIGEKPPAQLLNLSATAQVEPGKVFSTTPGEAITIAPPTVPQALANARIPVFSGGAAIAYVKGAQWVEPPSRLFQRLLSETVEARGGRAVLSVRQAAFTPALRVSGELLIFGIDAQKHRAVVRYDAVISRKDAIETRRFEASVPVSEVKPLPAAAALNVAANKVAAEVSDWVVGGNTASH